MKGGACAWLTMLNHQVNTNFMTSLPLTDIEHHTDN